MRVLLVAGGGPAAQIQTALAVAGFQIYTTDEGDEGVDLAKVFEYDAVLAYPEVMRNRVDLVRELRKAKVATPILVVSGDSKVETKVAALNAGADDYIATPASTDEIIARLHAVIRRAKGHTSQVIKVGERLTVDIGAKTAAVEGRQIPLTNKEYLMLEAMSLRKGQALTKDQLLNHLYGGLDEPEVKIIDVFICKLRKKLAEAGAPDHITTVWGRGYGIADEPAPRVPSDPVNAEARRSSDKERIIDAMVQAGRPLRPSEVAMACCWKLTHVYTKLSLVARHGLIENSGRTTRGTALYSPTAAGLAWHSARPKAVAA